MQNSAGEGDTSGLHAVTLDGSLVMAADTVAGYISGLLTGNQFKQPAYAFDRSARKRSLNQFLDGVAMAPDELGT